MPYTPPAIDDLIAQLTALAQARLEVVVGGARGLADTVEGSDILTQIEQQALLWDFFNQALAQFYRDFDYETAAGAALDAILAVRGLRRIPEGYAVVPVLCRVNSPVTAAAGLVIPARVDALGQAGYRFLAADSTGALAIAFQAMRDPTLPVGQAGVIPYGASSTFVLALADVAGTSGNVAPGAIRGVGSAVIGLDVVSNPVVQSTAAPVVGTVGAPGSATNRYAVVARGQQGRALPSATGTIATAAAILTPAASNLVSWQPVDDASGYDVLTLIGASWMLLGSTTAGVTSLADTGQTPQAYVVPTVNDANAAAGGSARESDLQFRARARQQQGTTSGGTDDALIRAARAVPGVTQAFVADGAISGTATLSYVAQPVPFPPLLAARLGTNVDRDAAAGAVVTVQQITPTPVAVAYTVVAQPNAPSDLIEQLNAAIVAYMIGLAPGQAIRDSVLAGAMQAITGVDHIPTRTYSVTGGTSYTNADVAGQAAILYGLGAITVTTGS